MRQYFAEWNGRRYPCVFDKQLGVAVIGWKPETVRIEKEKKTEMHVVTAEKAREVAAKLTWLGGGVTSIYIPEHKLFNPPEDGDKKFFHFAFANGADGINVALVIQQMEHDPLTWPNNLAVDIAQLAKIKIENGTPPVIEPEKPPLPPPDKPQPKPGDRKTENGKTYEWRGVQGAFGFTGGWVLV